MNRKISVLLVVYLLIFSVDLPSKEGRGAELVVMKNDGQVLKDLLVALKQNSLLLMVSGADVSVDIQEIKAIRISKKSYFLIGLLAGAVSGGLVAWWNAADVGWDYWAYYFIAIPAIVGGGIGALVGIDKSIKIEGKSDAEINKILEKLRHRALFPNAQ